MVPAVSYQDVLRHLDSSHSPGNWMCGLLFAPPNSEVGGSIVSRLDDWHHRSGRNFDFFCVGYVDWQREEDKVPVGRLTDRDGNTRHFFYDAVAFDDIRRHASDLSGWMYSGEADLVLVNAIQREPRGWHHNGPRSRLALDEIVVLDIDRIVRDRVFDSAARLMERLCQAADEATARDGGIDVQGFSDKEFLRTLLRRWLDRFVKTSGLGGVLKARHFVVGGHVVSRVL